MKRLYLVLALALALVATAQETLTNDAVIKMAKAGIGEGVIVSAIQNQPGAYKLTSDDLVNLKQNAVTDKVLEAMMAKAAASMPSVSPATSDPRDGMLPFTVAHGHNGATCHNCDFGSMFVTVKGIEFRGKQHSFKWSSDDIKQVKAGSFQSGGFFPINASFVEAVRIRTSQGEEYFMACVDSECKHLQTSGIYFTVLRQLGR